MHFPAAEILFEQTVLIALGGADFTARINDSEVSMHQPILVQESSVLTFGKNKTGARVYLAVEGGFKADQWLQSASTHRQVKAGGFEGRALQKNDRLLLKEDAQYSFLTRDKAFATLPWKAKVSHLYSTGPFHFIPGEEYGCLSEASKQNLEAGLFTIDGQSDRMGYGLRGEPLAIESPKELISSAVTKGTVQLLPNGQLIILMADHQTTGGYPRIAHLISADIPSLAQMRAGEKFSLQKINMATAENALLEQERNLQQLQNACTFRLQDYLNT
jgi:antagonist of KipI